MSDDMKIECWPRNFSLTCSPAAFARLRDLIIKEAELAGSLRGSPDDLIHFDVGVANDARPISKVSDGFALFGCAVVASVVLFLMGTGVAALFGLFDGHR